MLERNSGKKFYILTFDLEEWFHILDIDYLESNKIWGKFEGRICENTYRILDVFKENKIKVTFFVLGWIAKKYPDLILSISNLGHEIGTHSLNHILIYKSSPKIFRDDLKESIDIIQDITNKKVITFRAPGFSIKKETLWAYDILVNEGIEIDSSIFPASRGHGGIKDFVFDHPFRIKIGEKIIKEFPVNVFKVGRFKMPFSGGGYFRLIPFPAILYFCKKSDYVMTYFHPRDFDPNQPVIKEIPFFRRFKSYHGLKKSIEKFKKILNRFDFIDISTANKQINWDGVPLVEI